MREVRRSPRGFFEEADRGQILAAKEACEIELNEIEIAFTGVAVTPNAMLLNNTTEYAVEHGEAALQGIEEKHGRLPEEARSVFHRRWFGYLCGSFHHEIKHNQQVANVLINVSIAELHTKVEQGFRDTHELIRAVSRPTTSFFDPFATVPPLPPVSVERAKVDEPLRDRILEHGATATVIAVHGTMPGVGKTTAALRLCHDPDVRRSFEAIVWLSIGRLRVPLEQRFSYVANALNKPYDRYAYAAYQTLVKENAVLLVLDDVWDIEDVEPFRMTAGASRLVYTTRDRSLATHFHAVSHDVALLDDIEARAFLARWSGHTENSLPEPCASRIVSQCKGLALALAMVGASLKDQPDSEWLYTVRELEKAALKHVGKRPAGYGYETLRASIQVSVDTLNPSDRRRYLKLAVLLADMPAPEALVRSLWGGQEEDVHRSTRLFVDRSLAQRDAEGNIRLHALQLDYLHGEHSDPEALRLQHAALQLSYHIIHREPNQFASQMTSHLLAHASRPGVASFLHELDVSEPRPRLRPLRPTFDPAGGPSHRILKGHTKKVLSVAITADGKRAVSGSEDFTVRVWDLHSYDARAF